MQNSPRIDLKGKWRLEVGIIKKMLLTWLKGELRRIRARMALKKNGAGRRAKNIIVLSILKPQAQRSLSETLLKRSAHGPVSAER